MFRATAGREDAFQEEVRGVWWFLNAALRRALTIELRGVSVSGSGWVGDFPHLSPIRRDCSESAILIYTSGTTGTPKACRHALLTVLAPTRPQVAEARWLLAYAPFRWAGLSVLLHVLRTGGTIAVPKDLAPRSIVETGMEEGATHVSLTPSYFRRMLLSVSERELRRLPLEQVTFGGEAATQSVLNQTRSLWPRARVTHVYAASEFGDICSVSDGLAGIPREKFEKRGFDLTEDGELVIDGRPTADLWELRDERYHFEGRREEVINVGGVKVFPFDVEMAALSEPGVSEARAYGTSSALLGQVVALEYSGKIAEKELRRAMSKRLPKAAWPALVKRVEAISLTSAGKTKRMGDG
jgi:acyl-CoA synthetase (AMP-forming)/AMP-acid ligase II